MIRQAVVGRVSITRKLDLGKGGLTETRNAEHGDESKMQHRKVRTLEGLVQTP